MTDDRERTVKARISDPSLLDAFEDAEEGRTMAAVVREALEGHLLEDEQSDGAGGLSAPARTGLKTLREMVNGMDGTVPVPAAKSRVAAETNIEKGAMRSTVFEPLRERGYIGVAPMTQESFIVVHSERQRQESAGESDRSGARRESDSPAETARKYVNAGLEIPDDIAEEVDPDELARLREVLEEQNDDGARVTEALDDLRAD